jgi:hypothetical protein
MRRLLPLLALALAGCFGGDVPTEQIGGTQYGILLNVPSPVRTPTAAVTVHRVGTSTVIDSISVVASNLKPLAAPAEYQVYLVNHEDSTARRVRFDLLLTRTDTALGATGAPTTSTSTTSATAQQGVAGAPFNTTIRFRVKNGAGADSIGATADYVVITIQENPAAPAFDAATPKPLWFRFRTGTTITASGTASFGNFSTTAPRVFTAQGNGRSSLWNFARDSVYLLGAKAFGLTQPPVGYFYHPWVRDTRTNRFADLGDITDTLGNPLFDADFPPINAAVAQLVPIRFGTEDRALGARYDEFTSIDLVLEPKAGDPSFPGITTVLRGNIPGVLTAPKPVGTVRVTVSSGGGAVSGANVVVLAAGTSIVIGTGVTDAAGTVLVEAVPVGGVDVRVFPPAPLTAPAAQSGTVAEDGTLVLTFQVS